MDTYLAIASKRDRSAHDLEPREIPDEVSTPVTQLFGAEAHHEITNEGFHGGDSFRGKGHVRQPANPCVCRRIDVRKRRHGAKAAVLKRTCSHGTRRAKRRICIRRGEQCGRAENVTNVRMARNHPVVDR